MHERVKPITIEHKAYCRVSYISKLEFFHSFPSNMSVRTPLMLLWSWLSFIRSKTLAFVTYQPMILWHLYRRIHFFGTNFVFLQVCLTSAIKSRQQEVQNRFWQWLGNSTNLLFLEHITPTTVSMQSATVYRERQLLHIKNKVIIYSQCSHCRS